MPTGRSIAPGAVSRVPTYDSYIISNSSKDPYEQASGLGRSDTSIENFSIHHRNPTIAHNHAAAGPLTKDNADSHSLTVHNSRKDFRVPPQAFGHLTCGFLTHGTISTGLILPSSIAVEQAIADPTFLDPLPPSFIAYTPL